MRSFCDGAIANNANFKQNNANKILALFAGYLHYLRTLYKYIFLFSIFVVFTLLFYQSYLQYESWLSDEFSKYLLEQSVKIDSFNIGVNYFIFYVSARFFAPYFISLAVTLVFLVSAKKLNKKYDERFFEPEEPWFGALAFFLLGHPGWLFYFIILVLIYFVIHLLSLVISHKSLVISLYYLWMPMAIFVILIQGWLEKLTLWKLLIF